jgi:hypothetical protein
VSDRHPLRNMWRGMWSRCTNPRSEYYADYGGRGIGVDPAWKDFDRFCSDMGERPPGLTIERKNNDLGYSKENCVWASRRDQARNRRSSRLVTFNGKTQTMIAWAEELGITYMALYLRLYRRKLPVEIALDPNMPQPVKSGTANGSAKISEDDVRTIRAEYATRKSSLRQLSARYGMRTSSIWGVATGKTWKHIQ